MRSGFGSDEVEENMSDRISFWTALKDLVRLLYTNPPSS